MPSSKTKTERLQRRAEKKRAFEARVVQEMIALYYKKYPNPHEEKELLEYALVRISKCPFMETKTFCSQCQVHCYRNERRKQIRQVMRYSGPRMLLHHPVMALRHLYYDNQNRIEKPLFLLIGFVGLFLCVLGAILPVLPSFPFALMAAFGFARSSEKLHDRFVASRLYQDNAKDWVEHRAMRPQAKKRVLMTISLVLLCSWLMLFHLPWVQWILVAVWIDHVLYFRFGIRTLED